MKARMSVSTESESESWSPAMFFLFEECRLSDILNVQPVGMPLPVFF